MTTALSMEKSVSDGTAPSSREELQRVIEEAAHLLPAQGPITVFIHHNTLHAFEDLPFEEAVIEGSHVFGCKPFLEEQAYRQMLDRERIGIADLQAVLQHDLGHRGAEPVLSLCNRHELRLGATGFTAIPCRGAGRRHLSNGAPQSESAVRIEVIVPAAICEPILQYLRREVMPLYHVTACVEMVEAVSAEQFTPGARSSGAGGDLNTLELSTADHP